MKLFREFLSYLAYWAIVAVVAMAFAYVWHDFSVEFHREVHRAAGPPRISTCVP
jgi:hypothetical protein